MKKILLGVTGSIAAYKACELIRLFVKNGDEVTVVMTKAATEFVAPLTFQTLSRNPVFVDQFAPPVSWKPEHISLAESADLVVVAPATANTIAKMRYGLADNLLTATLLATRAPIVIALSSNDAVGTNLANLAALYQKKNVYFVPLRQDDPVKKPFSLSADFSRLSETVLAAENGEQPRPLFL